MYSALCQPWPHIWCGDISGINPEVTGHAAMAATEILWAATGRQFGNCAVTLRPCRQDCASSWPQDVTWSDGILSRGTSWGYPWPALVGGLWMNLACGVCSGSCSCSTTSEVVLGEQVNDIIDITIDGISLPASGYALYDGQRLVKTEGEWPTCQDWSVTGGPGTWIIEATFGADVPHLGQLAMGILTLEIARMCCGQECSLPPSVQRVTRQGVTMERLSAKDLLDEGLTGLFLPDKFIRTYNPSNIPDRARAYSPDKMPTRQVR